MIYDGKEIEFPAISRVSFYSLHETLTKQSRSKDKTRANHAKDLLQVFDDNPDLLNGMDNQAALKKNKKAIDKVARELFPEALLENEIKSLTPPFNFEPFYMSTRMQNIMKNAGKDYKININGLTEDKIYIFGCSVILAAYFNYHIKTSGAFVLEIPNVEQNINRSYRIAFNADMITVEPTERSRMITYEEYLELLDNYGNVEIWKKYFPPNSWIIKGVGISNFMDVTLDQSINTITSNLLVKNEESSNNIIAGIKSLFNDPDLRVGFMGFEKGGFISTPNKEMDGIILGENDFMACNESLCEGGFITLIKHKEPLIISDVEAYCAATDVPAANSLNDQGIKSYIIAPLTYNNEFYGFLELASETKYALNSFSMKTLGNVLPIISMAVSRFKAEYKNELEAVIQQECTTIHPAVKWRFEEEAEKYLRKREAGESPNFTDIVFKDIHPLYGQLDIKGSSSQRNEAVTKDLITQLNGVNKVLTTAYEVNHMPLLDELTFRIDNYRHQLENGLLAGSEHEILSFLKRDIYPVFNHFKDLDPALGKVVEEYNSILDPELHIVYDKRKNFDQSVMRTNYALASLLDKKQEEAQQMFPHYYERYKTDGVEYNLYIGQSMAKDVTFNPLYLKNMRLWQLQVMCELENEFYKLQKQLPVPLEVASLILAYNSSLSIHFRMDEKKFDVEGAYNARYEIVKKRVDKAHIKGTKERITVPGKIAIIYSSDSDAREYFKYINFLEDRGYLVKGSMENHDLENLQGISGLKALRVSVAYENETFNKTGLTVDQIIKEIEKA